LFCSNLAVEVGPSQEVLPALAKKLGAHTIIAEDEVEHVWRKVSRWPHLCPVDLFSFIDNFTISL
jgi:hypothetical protein